MSSYVNNQHYVKKIKTTKEDVIIKLQNQIKMYGKLNSDFERATKKSIRALQGKSIDI